MSIDPSTAKLIIKVALKAATDEEMQKRILIFILSAVIGILLLIVLTFYIITSPFQAVAGFFLR